MQRHLPRFAISRLRKEAKQKVQAHRTRKLRRPSKPAKLRVIAPPQMKEQTLRRAIMNRRAYVGAVTRRARSFTLLPFVFARVADARRITNLSDGQVSAWVLDLRDPACAPDVVRARPWYTALR